MDTHFTEVMSTEVVKSGVWPLPSPAGQAEREVLENAYLSSRSPTPQLDTPEVMRVLTQPVMEVGSSGRVRRMGPPSVAHSLVSESGERDDPSSVCASSQSMYHMTILTHSIDGEISRSESNTPRVV